MRLWSGKKRGFSLLMLLGMARAGIKLLRHCKSNKDKPACECRVYFGCRFLQIVCVTEKPVLNYFINHAFWSI